MKYTGWAVLIVGVLIGVYGLFATMSSGQAPPQTPDAQATVPISLGVVLLGFAAVVTAVGLGILLLGGRGMIKTKNLAVRN